MIRRHLLAAAVVVGVVNALVLVGVARNRSGQGQLVTLDEREFPLAWSSPRDENSGVALRFNDYHWLPGFGSRWRNSGEPWLVGERLRAIGFDPELPADPKEAERFARRQLSRRVFAAIQVGGEDWQAWLSDVEAGLAGGEHKLDGGKYSLESLQDDRKHAVREREIGSRLFVVDVGMDADALVAATAKRPNSFVMPAQVRLEVHCEDATSECPTDRRQLRGSVTLLIEEVSVPKRVQTALPRGQGNDPPIRLSNSPDLAPRYEVTLRVGSRHEPWIEGIRPLIPQR